MLNMISAETRSTRGVLCAENLGNPSTFLNRGIMPRCFSKSPLFTWGELSDKSLAQFVRDAWNSPVIQDIRMRWRNVDFINVVPRLRAVPS